MIEEIIEQIIRKYDSDREFIISEAYLDGGIDPLFRKRQINPTLTSSGDFTVQ